MKDKKWIHSKIDEIIRTTKNSKDSEVRLLTTILAIIKNLSKKPQHIFIFSHVVRNFLTDLIKHKLN